MTDPAPTDVRRLRATAHPLRLRMLSLLTGAELSAAEMARELGVTHANASYHLRQLLDAGEVVVAGEETIRGGVAKRYRHPWQELAEGHTPRSVDVPVLAAEMVRRHGARVEGAPRMLADGDLWLDDEDWAEVKVLLDRGAMLMHERARPPRAEGTRRRSLSLLAFDVEPDA